MKRSEMVQKIVAVLEEVSNVPNDIKAKSILAMQSEAGMLPPEPEYGNCYEFNDSKVWGNQWEPEDTKIFFWTQKDQYGAFSNFHPSPISILDDTVVKMGRIWPTVEHYFQAMKTLDWSEQEKIRAADSPGEAKRMGRKLTLRSDWEAVKVDVMLTALHEKFEDPTLKELLLSTEDAKIYEDSPYDMIWGTGERGAVGTGQNLLGKALMEVREAIRIRTVIGNLSVSSRASE